MARRRLTLALAVTGAIVLCAPAHETDNYTVPRYRDFVDLAPFYNELWYLNLTRAVDHVNGLIEQAEAPPQRPDMVERYLSDEYIARAVRRTFPPTLNMIDNLDHMLAGSAAERRFPGQIVNYRQASNIYDRSSFILDPRQFFKLYRSATFRIGDTFLGSDKIGHFVSKGHINYDYYHDALRDGKTKEEALLVVLGIGIGKDFFYSEKAMVGYYSSGVFSNADLTADWQGFKFYLNLTEPVMLKGEMRPPLLKIVDDRWALNDHVRPDSDYFNWFVSDHYDEVLNPNVMLKVMREPVAAAIRQRCANILAWYGDHLGNRRPARWFNDKIRELATYYGEEYGHERRYDEMITAVDVCGCNDDPGNDPGARTPDGRTGLHIAAENGDLPRMRIALQNGIDIDVPVRSDEEFSSEWGNTPLHLAARDGHLEAVRLLLDRQANVNARNDRGVTPLHRASNHPQIIRLLIDRGAEVDAADDRGRTPLHWAVTWDDNADAIGALLRAGADVNAIDNLRHGAMHYAANFGRAGAIDALAGAGASAGGSAPAALGVTPLHLAARKGHVEAIAALLRAGANPAAPDLFGATPLHDAAANNKTDALQAMLDAADHPDHPNLAGCTPLHEAARAGHIMSVHALLNAGADINFANRRGGAPIHAAAHAGHDHIVHLLIDRGAATALAPDGRTIDQLLLNAEPTLAERYSRMGTLYISG